MTNYNTEEPFIVASWSPAGPDVVINFYLRKVSIYDNGTLLLHTNPSENLNIGDNAPTFETQLEEADIEKIKKVIQTNRFWKLEEDLSIPSEDGSYSHITVNLTDQSKTVGGHNPTDPEFMEIFNNVFDLVADENYKNWNKEMEDYILKMNPEYK